MSSTFSDASETTLVEATSRFVIRDNPNGNQKDQSLYACEDIEVGEFILEDTPIISHVFDGQPAMSVHEAVRHFNNLSQFEQRVLSMKRTDSFYESHYRETQGQGSTMSDGHGTWLYEMLRVGAIFETFALPVSSREFCLFEFASRINHSCEPNAVLSYHEEPTPYYAVRPLRRIMEGEEITVSEFKHAYHFLGDKEDRHAALGFECICNKCMQNDDSSWMYDRYMARAVMWMLRPLMLGLKQEISSQISVEQSLLGDDETFIVLDNLVSSLVSRGVRGYQLTEWLLLASEFALRTTKFREWGRGLARKLAVELRRVEGWDSALFQLARSNYEERWRLNWPGEPTVSISSGESTPRA